MSNPRIATLDDLLSDGVSGRHVLVRADLNVPLEGGQMVLGAGRGRRHGPTVGRAGTGRPVDVGRAR